MNVTKCDKCKKIKQEEGSWPRENSEWLEGSARGAGIWIHFDLCGTCNKNLVAYLKKNFKIKKTEKV
jgi:hypothetical protein